jgi:hypothetical protein
LFQAFPDNATMALSLSKVIEALSRQAFRKNPTAPFHSLGNVKTLNAFLNFELSPG